MRLLPCARPIGILESAPRTSLRSDSADESWDGFWGLADESYYARCTRADGSEQWFRIADELVRVREERTHPPIRIGILRGKVGVTR